VIFFIALLAPDFYYKAILSRASQRKARSPDTEKGVKHTPHTFCGNFFVSFFVTLTKLAVGLEAKKSSARFALRPVFIYLINFWFPRAE